ncbi:MAG TPA: DNA-directed RNA polymerase subunit K [Candidatus Methanomethylia archaeon]|nr:DNA-directed RNA polymerase subunit K [Candidatus Methanomethylicia archaeon]
MPSSKTSSKQPAVLVGPPVLTRYEKARIIGARALQISMGAPVLVEPPPDKKTPLEIAEYELEQGILPITIRRRLPSGAYQDIPLKWLMKEY